MCRRLIFALVALLSALLTGQAFGQVNPAFADLNDEIEMVRSLGRLERKLIIEEKMVFSAEESQRFWPIYAEYEVDKTKINDRRLQLERKLDVVQDLTLVEEIPLAR